MNDYEIQREDLDGNAFGLFRKYATRSGRMDDGDLQESNEALLDKLRLVEGDYLKRAAALIFHPDPEKYVTGAFIKIAYFKEDANLIFQDEIHGNLFHQVKSAMELLTTKYLRALISYELVRKMDTLNRNSTMMAVACGQSFISEKNMLTLPRKLPRKLSRKLSRKKPNSKLASLNISKKLRTQHKKKWRKILMEPHWEASNIA